MKQRKCEKAPGSNEKQRALQLKLSIIVRTALPWRELCAQPSGCSESRSVLKCEREAKIFCSPFVHTHFSVCCNYFLFTQAFDERTRKNAWARSGGRRRAMLGFSLDLLHTVCHLRLTERTKSG